MGNMLGGENYYGDFVICKSCFTNIESLYILKPPNMNFLQ